MESLRWGGLGSQAHGRLSDGSGHAQWGGSGGGFGAHGHGWGVDMVAGWLGCRGIRHLRGGIGCMSLIGSCRNIHSSGIQSSGKE